ncbi:MAG: Sulfur carrier protein adenylyltransferase ThiF [uncultured Thiotrichaceae bacterium]|uniref:Sulfur carrier protein adenylyltransferase ThiF n=1 Tax=uncultured Thiotrichaceae bacterium TaxID=298394 RepID=A0A6S6S8N9_9GAMM|nr:MAG: Sulfur carrier protein adenylyltransferase ThiF [uncultured Thiotrichaceae bacterium]
MTPEQKSRYDRQIKLPAIGEEGQQRLLDARVLVIGMGGLGSPVALYLAAAGIGHLVISDYDTVEESNLQRQVIHTQDSINDLKVDSAKKRILAINPDIKVTTLGYELDHEELASEVALADAVVDCTDNFPSRFQLNKITVKLKTPLISGAAIRQDGQIATFDSRDAANPCYQCLYSDNNLEGVTCAMEGVVAPVVGIIGTMQAQETINVLLDRSALTGKLMLLDAQSLEWQRIQLPKNPNCPICNH